MTEECSHHFGGTLKWACVCNSCGQAYMPPGGLGEDPVYKALKKKAKAQRDIIQYVLTSLHVNKLLECQDFAEGLLGDVKILIEEMEK